MAQSLRIIRESEAKALNLGKNKIRLCRSAAESLPVEEHKMGTQQFFVGNARILS